MSTSQNDRKRDYVNKLRELDPNDPEFDIKFNHLEQAYKSTNSLKSNHRDRVRYSNPFHEIVNNFMFRSPFDDFYNPLSRMHDRINNMMYSTFDRHNMFLEDDEFDEGKLDDLVISDAPPVNTEREELNNQQQLNNHQDNTYYKYVSSMTTYDNNGVRKAKSISRTEKYNGKDRKVTQVSRFQDGNKYVEEFLNPDGTVKRIEKTVDPSTQYKLSN